MEIYVYSDESGVFDKVHNELFVFGGLILPIIAPENIYLPKLPFDWENIIRMKS